MSKYQKRIIVFLFTATTLLAGGVYYLYSRQLLPFQKVQVGESTPTDQTTEESAPTVGSKCSEVEPVIEGWEVFCTDKVGFAFDYPKEWKCFFSRRDDVNSKGYFGEINIRGKTAILFKILDLDSPAPATEGGPPYTYYEIKDGKYILHHMSEDSKPPREIEPVKIIDTVNIGKALIDSFEAVYRTAYLNPEIKGYMGLRFDFLFELFDELDKDIENFDQMISSFRVLSSEEISTTDWKTWDAKYHTMKYPKDWYLDPGVGNVGGIIQSYPDPISYGAPLPEKRLKVEIDVAAPDRWGSAPRGSTLEEWLSYRDESNSKGEAFTVLEEKKVTINGIAGIRRKEKWIEGPGQGIHIRIFIMKDNKLFSFYPAPHDSPYLDIFESMLDSFKFL